MTEPRTDTEAYQLDYLPWATALVYSPAATSLVDRAQADHAAVVNGTVLFQPPIERITGQLTLRKPGYHEPDVVNLIADFEAAQLRALAISSLKKYFVVLRPGAEEWPVRYGTPQAKDKDLLLRLPDLRVPTEKLVVNTAAALDKHISVSVPVGNVPEEAQDWSLEESDLITRTKGILRISGINTYGDLGVLSLHQLKKIDGIKGGTLEEIKAELKRVGWLSPAHR